MKTLRILTCMFLGAIIGGGCGSSTRSGTPGPMVDEPYESCYGGEVCAQGLTCAPTNLSVSSGDSGWFCTSGCNRDSDCLQVPGNYNAACVYQQCYLTCPSGNRTCPYDQECIPVDDGYGYLIDLCAP